MHRVDSSGLAGLPMACTLSVGDGAARMGRWEALSAKGRPSVVRSGHVVVVLYQSGPCIREELEALAAVERECCSFVRWDVIEDEDHVVLRVAADHRTPEDVTSIVALFGAGCTSSVDLGSPAGRIPRERLIQRIVPSAQPRSQRHGGPLVVANGRVRREGWEPSPSTWFVADGGWEQERRPLAGSPRLTRGANAFRDCIR